MVLLPLLHTGSLADALSVTALGLGHTNTATFETAPCPARWRGGRAATTSPFSLTCAPGRARPPGPRAARVCRAGSSPRAPCSRTAWHLPGAQTLAQPAASCPGKGCARQPSWFLAAAPRGPPRLSSRLLTIGHSDPAPPGLRAPGRVARPVRFHLTRRGGKPAPPQAK